MRLLNTFTFISILSMFSVAYADSDKLENAAEHAHNSYRESKAATKAVISDTMITAKVKTAIMENPGLSALDIHVTTKDRCVVLKGKVGTALQRDTAVYLAQNVEGVKAVYSSKLAIIG